MCAAQTPPTLIVEGWRFLPHSYAVVNQFQCLALLRRGDVTLAHRDAPVCNPSWQPVTGLLTDAEEHALRLMPPPRPGLVADVVYRIQAPYDFAPGAAPRTVVFGTAEYGVVPRAAVRDHRTVQAAWEDHGRPLVVTPSRWAADGFIRSGVTSSSVRVVPHGIDPRRYQPVAPGPSTVERAALRAQLGLDGFVFLHVGAMTPNKGLNLLLQAFAALLDRHPRAQLCLKGADALYPSGRLVAEALSTLPETARARVLDRLVYVGRSFSFDAMAALYRAAEAYVSPYLAEGFNMPALEAQACGLPVICTAGGPTEDFAVDGSTLRVESDQRPVTLETGEAGTALVPRLEHLVDQMRVVIENDGVCVRARQIGPAHAHKRFSWDVVTAQLQDVLLAG